MVSHPRGYRIDVVRHRCVYVHDQEPFLSPHPLREKSCDCFTPNDSREQNDLTTTILSSNVVHPQAHAAQVDRGASIGGGPAGDERLSLHLIYTVDI